MSTNKDKKIYFEENIQPVLDKAIIKFDEATSKLIKETKDAVNIFNYQFNNYLSQLSASLTGELSKDNNEPKESHKEQKTACVSPDFQESVKFVNDGRIVFHKFTTGFNTIYDHITFCMFLDGTLFVDNILGTGITNITKVRLTLPVFFDNSMYAITHYGLVKVFFPGEGSPYTERLYNRIYGLDNLLELINIQHMMHNYQAVLVANVLVSPFEVRVLVDGEKKKVKWEYDENYELYTNIDFKTPGDPFRVVSGRVYLKTDDADGNPSQK